MVVNANLGPFTMRNYCRSVQTMGRLTGNLTRKTQRYQSEMPKWGQKVWFAREAKFDGLSKTPCTDTLTFLRRT